MGIFDVVNRKPSVAGAIAVVVMLAAIAFIYKRMHPPIVTVIPVTAFYSDDDGATWFVDAIAKVPPFDHNGKEAVAAFVYRCGTDKPFIGRLEKYSPSAKSMIESNIKAGVQPIPAKVQFANLGLLVKKPGDPEWTAIPPMDSTTYYKFLRVKCSEGSPTLAKLLTPDMLDKP